MGNVFTTILPTLLGWKYSLHVVLLHKVTTSPSYVLLSKGQRRNVSVCMSNEIVRESAICFRTNFMSCFLSVGDLSVACPWRSFRCHLCHDSYALELHLARVSVPIVPAGAGTSAREPRLFNTSSGWITGLQVYRRVRIIINTLILPFPTALLNIFIVTL